MKKLRILLLFSLVFIYASYKIQNRFILPSTNNFNGYIINYKIDGSKLSMELKNKNKITATYYFKSEKEKKKYNKKLCIGCKVILIGNYEKIAEQRNFNLFSYKNYLKSKKIYYTFSINSIKVYKCTMLKYKIKNKMIKRINKSKNKEYLKLFLLGENELDSNIKDTYRNNGISHLFAISGMHITLLTTFILYILNKLSKNKIVNFLLVCIFLYLYACITNYSPSIIRAILFFIILNIKKIFKINISNFYLLLILMIFLLMYNPFYIYNLGFIYSFIISLCLIYFSNILNSKNYIKTTFKTSLISFLISLPINILNNFEINFLSPLINVFFVPFISFVIFPIGILNFIFIQLDSIYSFLINILEFISITCSKINFMNIILCKPPIYIIIGYYIYIINLIKKPKLNKLIILFGIILFHSNINYFNKYPIITMIDVGQGDSIIIQLPHNKGNILVDTGGVVTYNNETWKRKKEQYSIAKNTTIPYLKSIGINKIDYLILTHGDFDHMGEAITLVNNFKVNNVLLNSGSDNYNEILLKQVLEQNDIKYKNISKYNLNINGFKFKFINSKNSLNENEDSLVFYADLNNKKVLFTGDIGKMTELKLINEYNINNLDILKVGHHGSRNSSNISFIEKMNPKISIISAGIDNRFNHPNVEAINNLNKVNSKIYVTNKNGMIKLILKDKNIINTVF